MSARLTTVLALACAALAAPAAHAAGPAGVRVSSCVAAQAGLPGAVTYTARMGTVPGTRRMALRFRLFERRGDDRFRRVAGDGLDVWRKSRPGVSAFRFEHSVIGLRLGAVYRVVVHFRWYGSGREVIHRARSRSRSCRQPGDLPNLRVARLRARRGEVEGTSLYRVTVVNRGGLEAKNVGVLLRVDGEVVDEAQMIEVLEPGQARTVTFSGPVCRSRVTAVVDPREQIAESDESDNVRRVSCL